MSHAIEFIETPMFTRQIKQIATDEELRELQKTLIESPDKGDLIQKTGGLRKIRMATGNQGKSGSVRVIYFLATAEVIYLVMAYPKSTKDSLTDAEKAAPTPRSCVSSSQSRSRRKKRPATMAPRCDRFSEIRIKCTMYSVKNRRQP